MIKLGLAFFLTLIILSPEFATSATSHDGNVAGAFLGPYLPGSFPGSTEIMKVFGGRYGYYGDGFGFEVSAFHSAEDGSVINYFIGNIVKELPVPEMGEDLTALISAGLQGSYYRPKSGNGASLPYARSQGIQVSGGFRAKISDGVFGRFQQVILNGPGLAVLVEVGLELSLSPTTTNQK